MDVPTRRLLGRCDDLCIIRADYHPAFYLDGNFPLAMIRNAAWMANIQLRRSMELENKVSQVIERLPLLPIERSHKIFESTTRTPSHVDLIRNIQFILFPLSQQKIFHSPFGVCSERAQFFFFLYVKQKQRERYLRSSRKSRRLSVCALCTLRFLSSPFILALRDSRKLCLGNIHL